MRGLVLWTAALFGLCSAGAYPPDVVDKLAEASLPKLKDYLAKNPQGSCTLETAVRRKEWSDLSVKERKEYTDAVLCLQSKPALTTSQAPGAKSRFDDYVVIHILQTPRNHGSTFFLPWHRYYVWHYENALRTECNYTGYQPYWNWDRYAKDPANSPLFDGSEGSMGGNGAKVAHQGIPIPGAPSPYNVIPPGDGGGCVTTGPFKNMTVNVGPIAPTIQVPRNPRSDGLGYNPRCLRRDINKHAAAVTTANYTYDLITSNSDVYWFQTVMEGQFAQGKWGVHAGGHYTISGDPAGDFFVSPGDPAFWLHHAMIDRVWWIWQLQDLDRRLAEVSMTRTMNNMPPSPNGTLDDPSGLGVLAPDVPVRELMSTMGGLGGKFCYIYE
ncbi:18e28050-06f6-45fc-b018-0118a96aaa27 [Thermothielavioides terrestris]|uniref:18e28050-06f6-45fc-b018-0118a96aaa27 n=1 Tax=Thermothielavioides terrestris TaxID=2587410 RepID=A0A446BT56_9PEZI|nr:18e28050-06f6-45fc-b018-0118a96aaa27 [Thermothielavioides terrestris]